MRICCPLPLICCLLLSLTAAVPASADAASDAKKAIEAGYAKINAAIAANDSQGVGVFLAKDVTITSKSGRTLRKQPYLASLREFGNASKFAKITTKIEKFDLQKDKAFVSVREKLTATLIGVANGKDAPIVMNSASNAVWVRVGNGWQMLRTKETMSAATVDGKPIPIQ